ncbi:MAG: hypothetical protein HYY50_03265 [Candidatus Kerfeldbacteria bacterium]|nr:hypothetical protein [Candidatus Kerfeldbacteria bacterium]
MRVSSAISTAIGLVVLLSLGAYLWQTAQSNSTSSTNTNTTFRNSNTNQPAVNYPVPQLGSLGRPTMSGVFDRGAVGAGYGNAPEGGIYLQVFRSDGTSLDAQAKAKKSPAESPIEERAMMINGREALRIVGSVDIESVRTYVLERGFLYEFRVSNPGGAAQPQYEQGRSQLTFTN